jgi:fructokinase
MSLWGGIEAGGTKFVCATGTGPDDLRAVERFQTTTPEKTIGRAIKFFKQQRNHAGSLKAIGIGSFGPVDPNPNSPTFGYITSTPKPGWSHTEFAGRVKKALDVPVNFDTDVNAAALGEHKWGAAQGLDTFIYMTVGTGIGGGAMVNGKLTHGLVHPEMGHIRIPHDLREDPYKGFCLFHADCLEGLATGPAIEDRWGQRAETLPVDHPAWSLEAHYLALGLVNMICILSPQRIILGGGVMKQTHLFRRIRTKVKSLLNDYIKDPTILEKIDEYIMPPKLGGKAGVLGAIALAQQALI